jgi:UDP-N-acetylmuramyl tripeptide synthase
VSGAPRPTIPLRSHLAIRAIGVVNAASRRLGRGSGTVAGGRVGLRIDSRLLHRLTAGRPVALVSGTNGKTTTTALLCAALGGAGSVVTNATGANMPAGHVAALAAGGRRRPVVLEVDEGYVPTVVEETAPAVVVLLNLTRDQLDRTSEVRMVAARWRDALAAAADTTVVANTDDPLVVFGASRAPHVRWVSAGLSWRADAAGCPQCEGTIEFDESGYWACSCGFARPTPEAWLESGNATEPGLAVWSDGTRVAVALGVPGDFNRSNALMAVVAADVLGVARPEALQRASTVKEVAGRFAVRRIAGVTTQLLLAKNPAGWVELLELLGEDNGPVVLSINAEIADGRDPSWLWDVPFERLRGRPVVASGRRCLDLSVRLHYAEVTHQREADPAAAIRRASAHGQPVIFVGNYTAFSDLLRVA